MKSQIKNKKNKSCVELLIPTLNKFISYQFFILLLSLEGANHEPSQNN